MMPVWIALGRLWRTAADRALIFYTMRKSVWCAFNPKVVTAWESLKLPCGV